tara:strand:+ start:25459 stop:26076 length:618 start_codon:yes stop_codon:yes gene_type:complete
MLVFIDESGDPGFKLAKGSSPTFVTSMVIFDDHDQARACGARISRLMGELRVKPEFKFSKLYHPHRDTFFEVMGEFQFRTRSVVVQKELIYSDALRTKKESFYKFFIRNMLQHDGGSLNNAKVVIDGSGDRAFKKAFRSYLRKHLDANAVTKLDLKDSVKDPLVQLADMTAGAIARSYKIEKSDCQHCRSVMHRNNHIENVWEFK